MLKFWPEKIGPILARPGFGPAHCWPDPARPGPPDYHLYSRVGKIGKECVITLVDRALRVNLRVLDMFGYDVILGMDWLSVYRALLDCHYRRIILYFPYGFEIFFVGGKFVSSPFIPFDPC